MDILLIGKVSQETAKIANSLTTSNTWAIYANGNTLFHVVAQDGPKTFISDGTTIIEEQFCNLITWQ
jgi:hypothetical protein